MFSKEKTWSLRKLHQSAFLRFLFALYILVVIKVIIFKYPFEQLRAIADTWRKDVILEGLGTANFRAFSYDQNVYRVCP